MVINSWGSCEDYELIHSKPKGSKEQHLTCAKYLTLAIAVGHSGKFFFMSIWDVYFGCQGSIWLHVFASSLKEYVQIMLINYVRVPEDKRERTYNRCQNESSKIP